MESRTRPANRDEILRQRISEKSAGKVRSTSFRCRRNWPTNASRSISTTSRDRGNALHGNLAGVEFKIEQYAVMVGRRYAPSAASRHRPPNARSAVQDPHQVETLGRGGERRFAFACQKFVEPCKGRGLGRNAPANPSQTHHLVKEAVALESRLQSGRFRSDRRIVRAVLYQPAPFAAKAAKSCWPTIRAAAFRRHFRPRDPGKCQARPISNGSSTGGSRYGNDRLCPAGKPGVKPFRDKTRLLHADRGGRFALSAARECGVVLQSAGTSAAPPDRGMYPGPCARAVTMIRSPRRAGERCFKAVLTVSRCAWLCQP